MERVALHAGNAAAKRPRRQTPSVAVDTKRMPAKKIMRLIFERDGWRCRYCGCAVIAKEARNVFRERFPGEARKGNTNEDNHFGLATLSATLDHVLPFKRGGDNDHSNLVTACGPCQFGRGQFLLEEVQLQDPRLRPPAQGNWDGLMRLYRAPR